jgi:hypothetical protein
MWHDRLTIPVAPRRRLALSHLIPTPKQHLHRHLGQRLLLPLTEKNVAAPILAFSGGSQASSNAIAGADSGTRCSRFAFIRSFGTVQTAASRS